MSTGRPFERDKLIRFHHCDPAGIVFYPQYFVLFNELVEDWFNHGLHINFADMVSQQRLGTPMVHLETDFLSPSQIGEILRLKLAVKRIGRSSLHIEVEGHSGGTQRIRALLTLVLSNLDGKRSVPFPASMREKIEQFLLP